MKPKVLLELLLSEIKSVSDRHIEFCIDPNVDAVIQGRKNGNEHAALQEMVDRSNINKAYRVA